MDVDPAIDRAGLYGLDGVGKAGGKSLVEGAQDGRGLALGGFMCGCFGLETKPSISRAGHEVVEQGRGQAGVEADAGGACVVW